MHMLEVNHPQIDEKYLNVKILHTFKIHFKEKIL